MIDYERLKPGVVVKIDDGTQGVVKGSYLSPDGMVLRILQSGGIVQRNVPLRNVIEVVEPGRIDLTAEAHGVGTATPEENPIA